MKMYKRILIPTDGSKLSHATVKAGVDLAKALGATVVGFYATPP
jgi:nucleotide-binding universal stress UspA family protein